MVRFDEDKDLTLIPGLNLKNKIKCVKDFCILENLRTSLSTNEVVKSIN